MEKKNNSNNVANVKFVNLTPHDVVFNDGQVFPAKSHKPEDAARVSTTFTEPDARGICHVEYGEIANLPAPQADTYYIVSGMVLSAAKAAGRTDCVAPATGRKDTIRTADNKGIVSVRCFVD